MKKTPSLLVSLIPIAILIVLISLCVHLFGDGVTAGPSQMVLLFAAVVAWAIGRFVYNVSWEAMEGATLSHLKNSGGAIFILLSIGALTGSWMNSGVIPSMIYYGLKVIHPVVFMPLIFLFCSLISLMIGSSWTTIGTFGVALLGAGEMMGLPVPWLAGAIISGSYFGDKMSPLSDTTNLAASACGIPLYTHIRYMLVNTLPVYLICLVIYTVAGFCLPISDNLDIQAQLTALQGTFTISGWLLLMPIATVLMVVIKVPPFVTLFLSAIVGTLVAAFAQPQICESIAQSVAPGTAYPAFVAGVRMISGSVSIETGNSILNSLTQTSGMAGMLNTIWLILCVVLLAGVLAATGMLDTITRNLVKLMKNAFSTVASTLGTCLFFNITLGDQYMAIILPGTMFKDSYEKQGFAPELLSRSIEESATVTSVLIPWNTCAVAQSTVLGVATLTYLPYCFFNLITPFFSLLAAAVGYKIRKSIKQ